MTRHNPIQFAELLTAYRNNELDAAQKQVVEDAIARSPRLQELMRELDDKSKIGKEVELIASFDTEKAFNKVFAPKQRLSTRRFARVAAAIALPLLAVSAYLLLLRQEDPAQTETVAQSEPMPQSGKATLRLASGEVVSLDTVSRMVYNTQSVFDNGNGVLNVSGADDGVTGTPAQPVMHTLDIPNKMTYKIILDDGTAVWLNAGSTLRFPARFTEAERRVELVGEGYFQVSPDKKHRFVVSTDRMDIYVTGTSFNVKAYRQEASVQATLVEGRVSAIDRQGNQRTLVPSEQAVLGADHRISVRTVDIEPFIAWKDGAFYFKDARMEDIMGTIGRWYDLEVIFLDPSLRSVVYNGKMKMYESIDDVLRKFDKSGGLRAQLKYGVIFISSPVEKPATIQ